MISGRTPGIVLKEDGEEHTTLIPDIYMYDCSIAVLWLNVGNNKPTIEKRKRRQWIIMFIESTSSLWRKVH